MTELLDRARAIGFEVWRDRAVEWRKKNGVDVDGQWVESVKRMFERGAYDTEGEVKAALAALSTLPDAVAGERERCARIADQRAIAFAECTDGDIARAHQEEAEALAAAIRKEPS